MTDRNDIINLPNPHLRTPSKRVRAIGDDEKAVIKSMKQAALDWEDSRPHEIAVALAAVQIDKLVRIVIVRSDFDNKDDRDFVVLINPEITKREGDIITDHEGCLSVKDVYGLVPRYSKIRVRALDESGQPIRIKAEGFLARILQHEIDHTNGICFVDHITDDKKAFYKLTEAGELESVSYDEVQKSHILRD